MGGLFDQTSSWDRAFDYLARKTGTKSGDCGPTGIGLLFVKVRFSRCLFPIVQGPSTRGKDVS